MVITTKHIGTIFVPAYPISSEAEVHIGTYYHDYIVASDTGIIEVIRDKDLLTDGEYTVPDDFFDNVTLLNGVELEDDEW